MQNDVTTATAAAAETTKEITQSLFSITKNTDHLILHHMVNVSLLLPGALQIIQHFVVIVVLSQLVL